MGSLEIYHKGIFVIIYFTGGRVKKNGDTFESFNTDIFFHDVEEEGRRVFKWEFFCLHLLLKNGNGVGVLWEDQRDGRLCENVECGGFWKVGHESHAGNFTLFFSSSRFSHSLRTFLYIFFS